jgi:hypothetical protein
MTLGWTTRHSAWVGVVDAGDRSWGCETDPDVCRDSNVRRQPVSQPSAVHHAVASGLGLQDRAQRGSVGERLGHPPARCAFFPSLARLYKGLFWIFSVVTKLTRKNIPRTRWRPINLQPGLRSTRFGLSLETVPRWTRCWAPTDDFWVLGYKEESSGREDWENDCPIECRLQRREGDKREDECDEKLGFSHDPSGLMG